MLILIKIMKQIILPLRVLLLVAIANSKILTNDQFTNRRNNRRILNKSVEKLQDLLQSDKRLRLAVFEA